MRKVTVIRSVLLLALLVAPCHGFALDRGCPGTAGARLCDLPAPGGDTGNPADYQETVKPFRTKTGDPASLEASLPGVFDWRDFGVVTPVRDQALCSACWAFASAAVMESRILLAGGPETDLSEQQQISCNPFMNGCCGGDASALRYWTDEGPMQEDCTGYGDGKTACAASGGEAPCGAFSVCGVLDFRVDEYYTVNAKRPEEMKAFLVQDGPAYFRFELFLDFPSFWSSGQPGEVYRQRVGFRYGGHAVLLIGWDDGRQAWLCKNSWGAGEGPNGDGTFWIAYDDHSDDLDFGMTSISIVRDPACLDEDRDGYGLPGNPACTYPQRDCDDFSENVNSGMPEVCDNGIDDDCNGWIDAQDPACQAPAWQVPGPAATVSGLRGNPATHSTVPVLSCAFFFPALYLLLLLRIRSRRFPG